MISLRLSDSHETAIAALTRSLGISRSQWLRNTIEKELLQAKPKPDPHAKYVALMQSLDSDPSLINISGRDHSQALRKRFAASDRRAK
jgi:hypothetical protein